MDFNGYFNAYPDYFWQWEDRDSVLAIPKANTIAYRALVLEILDVLALQGVPPFGAMLLALIATNPTGKEDINTVFAMVSQKLKNNATDFDKFSLLQGDAISFLGLLHELPPQYRKGKGRILLFQAIFQNCHQIHSIPNSKKILTRLHSKTYRFEDTLVTIRESTPWYQDFRTIALLNRRFPTIHSIVKKIEGLPEFNTEELDWKDEIDTTTVPVKPDDFVEELIENQYTFQVGALIKRIWSGLSIPVHSMFPSQQPLGGVSDLTNKGDFDRLLISEFANDDLVFLSRLANNEALFLHREIPPVKNNFERYFLIDVSLKSWGNPKQIAFAIAIALAKHPKNDYQCRVFCIGNHVVEVNIDSLDTIITSLMVVEGTLSPKIGLSAFFTEFPKKETVEIFFITEATTFSALETTQLLSEHRGSIDYWIYTDALGNIDVYKQLTKNRKHVQHFELPLQTLWERKNSKSKSVESGSFELPNAEDYPILFKIIANNAHPFVMEDGEVFQISQANVFRFYNKAVDKRHVGWELVYENLPIRSNTVAMGQSIDGAYVVLLFEQHSKTIYLVNISKGDTCKIPFNEWDFSWKNSFFFFEGKFRIFHQTLAKGKHIEVDNEGQTVEMKDVRDLSRNAQGETMDEYYQRSLEDTKNKGAVYHIKRGSILKNINRVYINTNGSLSFNKHELVCKNQQYFMLDHTGQIAIEEDALREEENTFVFKDGSKVFIHKSGMILLKSSRSDLPMIYVPSALDASLGLATSDYFAGNEYYYKAKQTNTNTKIAPFDFWRQYINEFINTIVSYGTTH